MRSAGEPAGLVAPRIAHGDEFFAWIREGCSVSFGWVTTCDRFVGPVQLNHAPGRAFLYNFHTLEQFRGHGLYSSLLARMRYELAAEGITDLIIDVDSGNVRSLRGIQKAGFRVVASIGVLVLFGRWQGFLKRDLLEQRALELFR